MLPDLVEKPCNGGYKLYLGWHLLKPLECCQVHELVLHDSPCRHVSPNSNVVTLLTAGQQVFMEVIVILVLESAGA